MLKVLDTSCLLRFSYVLLGQKQPLLFLYCLFVALQVFGSCPSNVTESLVNLLWCSPWTWHHKDYSGANSEMMQTDLAGLAGYCAVSQNPVLGAFFNALLLASWNRHHLELFLETAFLFCVQTVLGISCHTGQGMDWEFGRTPLPLPAERSAQPKQSSSERWCSSCYSCSSQFIHSAAISSFSFQRN